MPPVDRDSALRFLTELLQTGSGDALPRLVGILSDMGLSFDVHPFSENSNCVVASWGEGSPRLCWSAHTDIPASPEGELSIHEETLYSPGSCSSRSALAAMLAALRSLMEDEAVPEGRLDLVITSDKESSGAALPALMEAGYACDMAVVGEPTGLDIIHAHAGILLLELRAFGLTAHGSVPWEGVNAIHVMMGLLDELSGSLEAGEEHPSLGRNSFNVGALHGGERPSRVPDICRALVDIRLMPGSDVPGVFRSIDTVMRRERWMDAAYRVLKAGNPMVSDPDSRLARRLRSAIGEATGGRPRVEAFRAWTEADLFRNRLGVEAVAFGPGKMESAGSRHESLYLGQFFDAAESYRIFAEKVLGLESYD